MEELELRRSLGLALETTSITGTGLGKGNWFGQSDEWSGERHAVLDIQGLVLGPCV